MSPSSSIRYRFLSPTSRTSSWRVSSINR